MVLSDVLADRRGRARRARGRLEPSRPRFWSSFPLVILVLARARQDDLGVRRGRFARCARLVAGDGVRVASRAFDVSLALARLGEERSRRRRRERRFPDASSRVARRVRSAPVPPRRRSRRDLVPRTLASRARHRVLFGRLLAAGDGDLGCAFADPESAAAAKTFRFEGTRRLYGDARFDALASAHVIVLGMGGVGNWAVEALARSGVGALTLVDLNFVCVTNVNRQVLAADSTVGAPKADVMAARVADINPECDVRVVNDFVDARNVEVILGLTDDSDSGARPRPRRPDSVLGHSALAGSDKAAVVACCVHHRVPILVTGGAGGVDTLSETVVEDLATATFNRLLQRVRVESFVATTGFREAAAPRFGSRRVEEETEEEGR